MCVVAAVIAVAFDGKVGLHAMVIQWLKMLFIIQVYLIEACLFPLFYVVYIAIVVSMSYGRVRILDVSLHYLKFGNYRHGGKRSILVWMVPLTAAILWIK